MTKKSRRKLKRKTSSWNRKIKPWIAYHRYYNGSATSIQSRSFSATDIKSGYNNPRWKELSDAGQDAGSNYSRIITYKVISNPSVNWKWMKYRNGLKNSTYTYLREGQYPMYTMRQDFNFGSVDTASLERELIVEMLGEIRGARSPFQALPFLGELKETIEMIRSPLRGIRKHTARYARQLRRNKTALKKAGLVSDILTDLYLQWTYGVSPLIGDIDNLKEAYMKLSQQEPKPLVLRVSGKISQGGSDGVTQTDYTPCLVLHTYATEARIQIKVCLEQQIKTTTGALDTLGVNLNEFVPTLWELLPYSFLIDYVTNVGDVIGGACTSLAGLRWAWMSIGQRKVRTNYVVPIPLSTFPISYPLDLAIAAVECRTFNRTKPSLTVKLSDIHLQLPSLRQEANTVVLGFSMLRGWNRRNDWDPPIPRGI